jgi:hypothetical protein
MTRFFSREAYDETDSRCDEQLYDI